MKEPEVREKLLDLANKISGVKRGSSLEIKPEYPEYKILLPNVTDEMAEVALHLKLREPQSAKEISLLCGKSEETCSKLLMELAYIGLCFVNEKEGVDKFWHDSWVPGHMEIMVNNKENVKKHPEIARYFDEYGLRKGPMGAGIIPVGLGPMRVIPIEKAIDGDTRRASFEEVSKYLNDNTVFTVSDCSCRTSREAMGEGCGHLKEDMCIQMGHAAEYYIRTGRGREITREEAFEIIKRAEDNGLVHQIPNTDGSGKTHAICNCCGCSCFAFRLGNMYKNPDMIRSNYVSEVDSEKCVACGECVENCPTNALTLGQKLCDVKPLPKQPKRRSTNSEWGPDKWNIDYRTNRKVVTEEGTSPCKAECPAHIGVQGYIKLASQGRYRDALELIKGENPFPAVCGRICPRKCESACTRGDIDDAVAIDDIKKFIADKELEKEGRFIPKKRHDYGKKIAVVGAGPSGLSCAYYLAIDGYKVTVFEKETMLGGMLTFGIPSFRLEKSVVNAEIEILKELGVEFKTGVEVGKDISLDDLRKEDYKAFYLAIGAQNGRSLGLENEEAEGVFAGVDFLREVALGRDLNLEGKTIVIGGGNVAIDVARTATRVSSNSVDMFCLESREQMPALEEEIEEALEEKITINNGWGPTRIIAENGKVTGVEFQKCLSVFNEEGQFSPRFDKSETKIVEAQNVLLSVGQSIFWGDLLKNSDVKVKGNGTVEADKTTLQTGTEDIFVGGDSLTGPRFAIDAIALGKEGAISIHRFVQPGQSLVIGRTIREYKALNTKDYDLDSYDRVSRQKSEVHHDEAVAKSFHDPRPTFTEEQMKAETQRCLGCGATVVDPYMCVGCGVCTTKCKFEAISLKKVYDKEGLELRKMKAPIIKNILKRKVKVAVHKASDSLFKTGDRA